VVRPDLAKVVVEVLHNRGGERSPHWSLGSGFVVGERLVLTAAHNVGDGEVLVRLHGTQEYPATVRIRGDEDTLDIAVLEVNGPVEGPRLRYALIDCQRSRN
jgi:hypothetical protein